MILNPNESGKFWNFLCFVHKNVKSEYKLKLSEEFIGNSHEKITMEVYER